MNKRKTEEAFADDHDDDDDVNQYIRTGNEDDEVDEEASEEASEDEHDAPADAPAADGFSAADDADALKAFMDAFGGGGSTTAQAPPKAAISAPAAPVIASNPSLSASNALAALFPGLAQANIRMNPLAASLQRHMSSTSVQRVRQQQQPAQLDLSQLPIPDESHGAGLIEEIPDRIDDYVLLGILRTRVTSVGAFTAPMPMDFDLYGAALVRDPNQASAILVTHGRTCVGYLLEGASKSLSRLLDDHRVMQQLQIHSTLLVTDEVLVRLCIFLDHSYSLSTYFYLTGYFISRSVFNAR